MKLQILLCALPIFFCAGVSFGDDCRTTQTKMMEDPHERNATHLVEYDSIRIEFGPDYWGDGVLVVDYHTNMLVLTYDDWNKYLRIVDTIQDFPRVEGFMNLFDTLYRNDFKIVEKNTHEEGFIDFGSCRVDIKMFKKRKLIMRRKLLVTMQEPGFFGVHKRME